MTAAAINSREQTLAGALAFAMHVLFLALLVFGVSWQHQQVNTTVVVDLWRDLPTVMPPKVAPPPKPVVKPEPPPPAPKAEVKPPPPKPEPAPKPDIALKEKLGKEKLEKERKLKELQAVEAKKLAADKARQAELEKQKRAAAEALKQKQAADAAAKSLAAQQQKMLDAQAAQQAAAAQREIDRYMDGIRTKVKRFVLVPPSVQGNPEAEVVVTLLPGGDVLDVKVSKSSGNAAYDEAIVRAISRARPFVVPTGDQFQRYFRSFTMAFRPQQ